MRTIIPCLHITATCLTILLASGCTTTSEDLDGVDSVTGAGVTSFRQHEEVRADGSYVRTVKSVFGKEYGGFELSMKIDIDTGKLLELDVKATDVAAFEGQKAAGEVVKVIREELTKQNIAIAEAAYPIIADVIAKLLVPAPL